MKRIENYNLPDHLNTLHKQEASSVIELAREIAEKTNELVDAFNGFSETDLNWKQNQEGIIHKGVIYMKDNLINSLNELLKAYDHETIKNYILSEYGSLMFTTPQMFGAVGDGISNDTEAIEKAIDSLTSGGIVYFPRGTYKMTGREVFINKEKITFIGEGKILCDYGFRPKASNFKAFGMDMESIAYSQNSRAFMIDNSVNNGEEPSYIENFTFKDCIFKNFFYSVCCIGGGYNFDGTEGEIGYPVRDVVIENCYSSTYTDKNAGHFQSIQIENISYINNRTYGGQNASSYNVIKGNGYIRVIGNYDHNNSYASCEIENGSGKAVIANNTFSHKIWIDDSYDVVVNANITENGISVTVGSNNGDSKNIVISNNVTKNIRCEQFGTYLGGLIQNVNISGNTVNGDNTHGIWIHGNAVVNAKVSNNFITGTNTNDISIQRNEQLKCYISGNFGNGKNLLIAGSGGTVFAVDNYNINVSGTRDSLPTSHYEREFNGIRMTDSSGVAWRVNINSSGQLTGTKY